MQVLSYQNASQIARPTTDSHASYTGAARCSSTTAPIMRTQTRCALSTSMQRWCTRAERHELCTFESHHRRLFQVDLFHTPGQSDLTADVDFAILRKSASAVVSVPWKFVARFLDLHTARAWQPGITALGPVRQSDFLFSMGMAERLQSLIEHPDTSDEQVRSRWLFRSPCFLSSASPRDRARSRKRPPHSHVHSYRARLRFARQAQSLYSACERLVDPTQMGEKYKVLGLVDSQQRPPLAGFG